MASEMFPRLKIPLEVIVKATDNFHPDNKIGHGDFGPVYIGQLEWSGKSMKIAARRLDRRRGLGGKDFLTEVSMLSNLDHPNIVSIIGFCEEENGERIIVTTYVPNGSLEQFLDSPNVTWAQRLKICVGAARALTYLHSNHGVLHRFISSSTILVDESWEAKLSGFEISIKRSVEQMNHVFLCEPIGTRGYMDPASVKMRGVTCKSDIYSFGIVLFELLCGRKAYIKNDDNKCLDPLAKYHYKNKTLKDIIHPDLCNQMSPQSLLFYSRAAYSCLEERPLHRRDMNYVYAELQKALEAQTRREEFEEADIEQVFQLTHENIPERVQDPSTDQHADKLKKASREIFDKKFEHLRIGLNVVKEATDNFSPKHIITMNASYPLCNLSYQLYIVPLKYFDKENPNSGAIKRIYSGRGYDKARFYREIEMLNSVKHPNIVTLLGFCDEGSEMILLIDDVSNGPLGDYFENGSNKSHSFTWEERLKICVGVAHAIRYIHYEMEGQMMLKSRLISKSAIVLDKNWVPKIIDFGFKFYVGNRITDVYSFGVLLFQILYGRASNDPIYLNENSKGLAGVVREDFRTGKLENKIDPALKGQTLCDNSFLLSRGPHKDSLKTFINIAHRCIQEESKSRPTMKVVVEEIEKLLSHQKDEFMISLEDIKEATQNFHKDNYVGRGGFGKVYRGTLRDGNENKTIVAKKLDKGSDQGQTQFLNELEILMKYEHENIIGLVGYCNEKSENIIVYEYASRGSLNRHLKDPSLTWIKRLNICIDVARALKFLHGGVGKQAKVIHRDIKTENILVNADWKGKLADFGLSLISPLTREGDYIIDYWCGTPGYVDPVYQKSRLLTIESDIYSFGVVLFEILCGKSTFAINQDEGRYLPDYIKSKFEEGQHDKVVFEHIREHILPGSLAAFQEISYQCLQLERKKRPTMKEVLRGLKMSLKLQNMASAISKCASMKIPFEDVVKATNNFDYKNIVGDDMYGRLYKGRLLRSGNLVNITAKRLQLDDVGLGDLEFWTKVAMLSDLKHTNLVSVIGFCVSKNERIIVTMNEGINGNLSLYLTSPEFRWTIRLRICVGVARALSYLHHDEGHERDYRIIHRLITSFTIWFDENWETKLSTFMCSVKQSFKDPVLLCKPIGVTGYMDPSVEETVGVTHKSDIYSFGVVLFEILCGREAYIHGDADMFLAPLAKRHYEKETLQHIILPGLSNLMSPQSLVIYSEVAYSCLHEKPECRPDASFIVYELERAYSLQLYSEVNSGQVEVSNHDMIKPMTQLINLDAVSHVDSGRMLSQMLGR